MVDTPTTTDRPDWACVLCPPPREGRQWRQADQSYRTCSACLDGLRDRLKDVCRRYLMLNPRPGANSAQAGRGAPGFGSRSPASDHVITMRDPRSKSCEVVDEWFEPVRLPHNLFGHDRRTNPRLADIDKPHLEQERPPRSVPAVLASLTGMVAEDRDMQPPPGYDVPDLCRWLDVQLDYVTRQEWVVAVDEDIRGLAAQLRAITEPRRKVGKCPNVIDEGVTTRVCDAPLHAPVRDDEIRCGACGRRWPRAEWLRLGSLLRPAS